MLNHIAIQNLAIVDSLSVDFQPGFAVLTGETGAGKSILIDALGLVLGERSDSSMVRNGSDRADITASFNLEAIPGASQWLSEHELDSDDECIIRRTINSEGRSKAFINGQPVPVAQLKNLSETLINIHGQHAHQQLLKGNQQRVLLDTFAANSKLLKQTRSLYQQWLELSDEKSQLSAANGSHHDRLTLLRYQVEELDSLNIEAGELENLEAEFKRLNHAQKLIEQSQQASQLLNSDEGQSALAALYQIQQQLISISDIDEQVSPISELVNQAIIPLEEADNELRHYCDSLELDPERLNEIEGRLNTLHDLARKHQVNVEEVAHLLERLSSELERLENAEQRLASIDTEISELEKEYFSVASKLTQSREKAAKKLAKEIVGHIKELGMGQAKFEIALLSAESGSVLRDGVEQVEMRVSANPGQPAKPLTKVASGGELSRISLAIQLVTAQQHATPTLIFDEVDVGIGGGVAEKVGNKLRLLGKKTQVLCVTHQPQVAAQAHHHFNVVKSSSKNSTSTHIDILQAAERIEELSRMLGGIEITDNTRAHAKEMLQQAQ